jgi:membrane-anchored mycosin MYCP
MRPARPRAAFPLRRAVTLVPAIVAAGATIAATPAAAGAVAVPAGQAGNEPATLPGVTQTLAGDASGCLTPSAADSTRVPWPQTYLRPESVWPLTQGTGVKVAVVGSGVDDGSGVFGARLTPGPRLLGPGSSTRDCVGHGTFVAGLIAARRRAGIGFAGIAPQAAILSVAVTDDTGVTTAGALAAGIRAAADAGAEVIDVAVPVTAGSPALSSAVTHAAARGALVVAPAAADAKGADAAGPVFPATYPDVLAVSDLGPGGRPPPPSTGAGRVDLTAPGDAVMSVGPGGHGNFTATGPSCAAAFVAGTAALVLAYRPHLSVAGLRRRLEATAYRPGTTVPDPVLGYGTVDPVAAVGAALPEESGTAVALPVPRGVAPLPAARPRRENTQEYGVAAVAAAVIAFVVIAGLVIPRGRRRGWRPGVRQDRSV